MVCVNTVSEIAEIIKDQEKAMRDLLRGEKIIQREYILNKNAIQLGVTNIIKGVRRCSKSVFALMLSMNEPIDYLNFEDERLNLKAEELNRVVEAIYTIKGNVNLLVFDEIQEVLGWEKFVSRLVNSKKVILTGSSARMLSSEFASRLTGRRIDHILFPFSFREFLDYQGFHPENTQSLSTLERSQVIAQLENYLIIGGFPLALKLGKPFLVSLYGDIIERDVVQRYSLRKTSIIKDLARYLVSNSGQEISFNKLRNIFHVKSKHAIQDWVGFLESSYLIFKLERFSHKLKESIIAPKKVYAIDTGLVNAISANASKERLMETVVAVELQRRKNYHQKDTQLNYWKSHAQEEVDFVVRRGEDVVELIQVTYASIERDVREREVKNLVKASHDLKCNNLKVITWDYRQTMEYSEKRIEFIPLWEWLLQIA